MHNVTISCAPGFDRLRRRLALLALGAAAGCGAAPEDAAIASATTRRPMADGYLNQKWAEGTQQGILTPRGADGRPDPSAFALAETARYYGALGRPGAPGESAPATLSAWKETFGFGRRDPRESVQAYRDREGVAVFYNSHELGLGHELGCRSFVDGQDERGQLAYGQACYLGNYGFVWQGGADSLDAAVADTARLATFAITYRPRFKPAGRDGYEVQFYVFDPDGARQDWAQFDPLGPRPVPQVCTGCHGGSYDTATHLTHAARFLPVFPDGLEFAEGPDVAPGATRAGQQERLRVLNETIARAPLSIMQSEALQGGYPGGLSTPGATFVTGWAPPGWSGSPAQHDLYDRVVRPYCFTCHAPEDRGADEPLRSAYTMFESYEAFVRSPVLAYVCGAFTMPNAQPTLQRFWGEAGPVVLRDANGAPLDYPSAADALLAALGRTRADCAGLAQMSDCRGRDEAICGDAAGGLVCGASGQCESTP